MVYLEQKTGRDPERNANHDVSCLYLFIKI